MTIDKASALTQRPGMSIALDDRDLEMLRILASEGRIPKSELARRVNLSATPCLERLKRLEKAGLIRGYRAEISLARLGASVTVFVVAELESHRAESFRAFEHAIARHDEIVAVWAIGGGFDYLLQVVTRDIESYQRLIDALLGEKLGLTRYFTYIVTKQVKAGLPPLDLIARSETGAPKGG